MLHAITWPSPTSCSLTPQHYALWNPQSILRSYRGRPSSAPIHYCTKKNWIFAMTRHYQIEWHFFYLICVNFYLVESFFFVTPIQITILKLHFSPVALRPNAGQGLLILGFLDDTHRRITVGRTSLNAWQVLLPDNTQHSQHNRQTSTGLLWTSDQPVAQTSTWQHTTLTAQQTNIHRTPLDEWSARRTDLYLTTHNTHNTTNIHRTPLDEWSARRTDLYLTTHNTHNTTDKHP